MSVTVETNMGPIKIELFCEQTPKNCENFLALCASGYFNGCEFHRNIPGFIVQTGDPTNEGLGGESIWQRPYKDEIVAGLKHHARGVVSMANNGPDANGSQWFITYNKQESLDGAYTIIGHVIHGMDTLDKVAVLECACVIVCKRD